MKAAPLEAFDITSGMLRTFANASGDIFECILYNGTIVRNPRGKLMRLLAVVRLSRLSESTTSVDTQAENLEEFARRHGHTIVALTEDLDVSGGKPIRERPGIGPWFKRLDEWDARQRGVGGPGDLFVGFPIFTQAFTSPCAPPK